MLKNLILVVFSCIFLCSSSFSQKIGRIEIHADPRIDLLVKKQGGNAVGATATTIPGYRIQLLFDQDKKTIDEARNRFTDANPEVSTYVLFNAPNFFLKAGDFRTQLEAEKLKERIIADFPTSFIIKEQVNLPPIEQD
jgi:hypothetical protein